MVLFDQSRNGMRSDKTSSAGDQDPHQGVSSKAVPVEHTQTTARHCMQARQQHLPFLKTPIQKQ